jgi:IS1 family transposase
VAFEVGDQGVTSALALLAKARRAVGRIALICTDANRCYELAFATQPEPHLVSKAETHRIESSNAAIRDNLARFNRRSKRGSKSWQMLAITLDLFFNRHLLPCPNNMG